MMMLFNPSSISIKEAAEVTCDQARRKREFTTKEDNLDTAHSHDPTCYTAEASHLI